MPRFPRLKRGLGLVIATVLLAAPAWSNSALSPPLNAAANHHEAMHEWWCGPGQGQQGSELCASWAAAAEHRQAMSAWRAARDASIAQQARTALGGRPAAFSSAANSAAATPEQRGAAGAAAGAPLLDLTGATPEQLAAALVAAHPGPSEAAGVASRVLRLVERLAKAGRAGVPPPPPAARSGGASGARPVATAAAAAPGTAGSAAAPPPPPPLATLPLVEVPPPPPLPAARAVPNREEFDAMHRAWCGLGGSNAATRPCVMWAKRNGAEL